MRFSPRENKAASVGWREWSEEAFREAERHGKLVLLSISASWCHWCHVMDETTYSDPLVRELIHRYYVPVRVDTDLQPEINRRYNQGGWPTTAFLDPEGRLLAGSTYIPPETMRKVLERMYALYKERRHDLEWETSGPFRPEPVGDLRRKSLETAGLILVLWDRPHGGIGNAPKFPLPEAILLALEAYHSTGKKDFLSFAHQTLSSMVNSRLFDEVEGGFFRYSVTADWNEPHYEKLLEDNALLLLALEWSIATGGDGCLVKAVEATARYITTSLYGGQGLFHPSQDASEEYYLLGKEEREKVEKPAVDPLPLSRPAAIASRVLMRLGASRKRGDWQEVALEALERVFSTFEPGSGVAHVYGYDALGRGHLEDQTAVALALLDAYSLMGEDEYLRRSYQILELVLGEYGMEGTGLLADVADGYLPAKLTGAPAPPEALGEAATALAWGWAISGEGSWRDEAHSLLADAFSFYANVGVHASPLARAGLLLTGKPLLVKLPSGREYGTLSRAFLSLPHSLARPVPHEPGEGEPPFLLCHPDSCLASAEDAGALMESIKEMAPPPGSEEGGTGE